MCSGLLWEESCIRCTSGRPFPSIEQQRMCKVLRGICIAVLPGRASMAVRSMPDTTQRGWSQTWVDGTRCVRRGCSSSIQGVRFRASARKTHHLQACHGRVSIHINIYLFFCLLYFSLSCLLVSQASCLLRFFGFSALRASGLFGLLVYRFLGFSCFLASWLLGFSPPTPRFVKAIHAYCQNSCHHHVCGRGMLC